MKITQIRENGDTEALSVVNIDLLIEKMKRETKLRPVSELRQALHFVLPDEPCSLTSKLPRVIPAAAFGRVNGVRQMKTYNGIVELTVGPLAGKTEVEIVKQRLPNFLRQCWLSWEQAAKVSRYGLASPDRTALCRKQRKKPKCFRHMPIA